MKFEIVETDEIISNNTGLVLVNNIIEVTKFKHKALIGEGNIAGKKVLLVKPQTYMNLIYHFFLLFTICSQ